MGVVIDPEQAETRVIHELIDFAAAKGWTAEVLRYAQSYARQVTEDWKMFKKAATAGQVPLPAGGGGGA